MKFIAIGELMLRLSPPNYEKIVTTHDFIVNYGGAEANVAVSLANLGVDSTFFTVLPNTDLGKSTINYLKANDVHTKHIIKADGRMGLYYLEEGVAVRASQAVHWCTVHVLSAGRKMKRMPHGLKRTFHLYAKAVQNSFCRA